MKRSILAIILCLFLITLAGCSFMGAYSGGKAQSQYISLTYIDANLKYKSADEARDFLKNSKDSYVKWTVPIKSVVNNKYVILQAGDLNEVYAEFDNNLSQSAKLTAGQYITISGHLASYCPSLLGEAPYWTLKNCKLESVSSKDEDELKLYLKARVNPSLSSSQAEQTVQPKAFNLKPSDFKTELTARDANFTELPSFKDGGDVVLGDYYYTYGTGNTSDNYEIFVNGDGDSIYSIELSQNVVSSDGEKLSSQKVYDGLLFVVYGNNENKDYTSAAGYVKDFIARNTKYNDFHVATTTIGSLKLTLEIRRKTQEFRMIIQPEY